MNLYLLLVINIPKIWFHCISTDINFESSVEQKVKFFFRASKKGNVYQKKPRYVEKASETEKKRKQESEHDREREKPK